LLAKRIIPCLDVKAGRVVKGVRFRDHRDAGDPSELAAFYNSEGADELVFYDITASAEDRDVMLDVVERAANEVFIPLSVGGGLRSVDDMARMLHAGADKVSINTAAVENPALIEESARAFGSQCIVLGLDAIRDRGSVTERWDVRVRTGDGSGRPTKLDAVEWAVTATQLGAGEVVVNSMDEDGRRKGYDLALNRAISEAVGVPVIASGGAGGPEHMYDALEEGRADAVLAASIFHYGEYSIAAVKKYLSCRGVPIRPLAGRRFAM
jgi:cyclase